MGCDIHAMVEVRRDGVWHAVPAPKGLDEYADKYEREPEWYPWRCYSDFALLANVRNDGKITPIAEPRGVPADASAKYKADVKGWDTDGHSHSWLTLAELTLPETITTTGVVSAAQYQEFKCTGQPREWCGGISGPGIQVVTPAEMESTIAVAPALRGLLDLSRVYTVITWTVPFEEYTNLRRVIDEMAKLGAPDDVRLVFFFDN